MKRKVKKFNEGGKTYDKEDEGILGGKINYREEDGRKYVAGKATPFDRNPSEQRYYSMDDVKGKLSGLFGGKKEEDEPKKSTTMPSGYEKLDVSEKTAPSGKTYLREEADIDYKSEPAKKVIRKDKVASDDKKPLGKGATLLPGKADDKAKKPTPLPGKAEDDKPAKYEDGKSKIGSQGSFKFDSKPVGRTRAGTVVKSSEEPSALDKAAANEKYVARLKKQNEENEARKERIKSFFSTKSPNRSYKSGGSVKSSASSRGDGCAVRGKTKGRIY